MVAEPAGHPNSRVPAALTVHGELQASEDVIIEGQLQGQVTLPGHHLSIHRSGEVRAKVVARVVTLAGTLEGSILASERVEILPGATMRGHVTTPSLLLMDGARFNGTVDPERTEAAMHVARYRQRGGAPAEPLARS